MFIACSNLGKMGALGNQLFQIAATIGTARRLGWEAILPPWRYAPSFTGPFSFQEPTYTTPYYMEPSHGWRQIETTDSIDLMGHYQSEKYFAHCAREIRQLLTPAPALLEQVCSRWGEVLAGPTCAMHVRRGDYLMDPNFANLGQTDYYERALSRIPPDHRVLVMSDDPAWCRSRFLGERFMIVEGQSDVQDLALMTLCNRHIIANSTFSWWGAWLAHDPPAPATPALSAERETQSLEGQDRPPMWKKILGKANVLAGAAQRSAGGGKSPGREIGSQEAVIAPSRWFDGDFNDREQPYVGFPNSRGYHESFDIRPLRWLVVPANPLKT